MNEYVNKVISECLKKTPQSYQLALEYKNNLGTHCS